MISDKQTISKIKWRRINMRTVGHLLGVEFMHDLYNRHVQRINFIRFRNTVTIWKDGTVNSYAPEKDFNLLEKWFGEKFYSLDKTVLKEFQILLNSDRSFFNEQISRFESVDLTSISDTELGLLLIDIQQYSLGELYKMNFVQAEYSLTSAIKRILSENIQTESLVNDIFSKIILTNIPTESQEEEIAFLQVLNQKQSKDEEITPDILLEIEKLHTEYAYMHSAYGEDPYAISYYIEKWKEFDPTKKYKTETDIRSEIQMMYEQGQEELKQLNNEKLNILVPLMIQGGTFRDKNKASLGYTIQYKHKVFDEIARRRLENRSALNFYLLSEILELLDSKTTVSSDLISKRQTEGVILVRSEYMDTFSDFNVMDLVLPNGNSELKETTELKGRCACSGCVEGTAKVIYKKEDSIKIVNGDIMIAVGTDFDLMDAIHRSAGIITEEGGLLSHASVVSREMRKPCIIGVNNATAIIKDGDHIILDAQKGVITIKK